MKRADQTLTIQEAAKRLGLHEQTVRKYVRAGLLRAFKTPSVSKFGVRFRIKASDLEKFRTRHLTTHAPIPAPKIERAGEHVGNGEHEPDPTPKNSPDPDAAENLY